MNLFFTDTRSHEFYKNFEILPGPSAQKQLHEDFKILIARAIVAYLPAFKEFNKYVNKHIIHTFTEEMSKKSEVVIIYYALFFIFFLLVTYSWYSKITFSDDFLINDLN